MVVGVPGQVVVRSKPRAAKALPDLDHDLLPDTIGETISVLFEHVKSLEDRMNVHADHAMRVPDHGVWHGEDFSI